jgi:hypothetical protein
MIYAHTESQDLTKIGLYISPSSDASLISMLVMLKQYMFSSETMFV